MELDYILDENSNGDIEFVVRDSETGDAIADVDVLTASWSLRDTAGTIINSRTNVAISSPGGTISIVLDGDDLAITDTTQLLNTRYLTLVGTWNDTNDVTRNFTQEVKFKVRNLRGVS